MQSTGGANRQNTPGLSPSRRAFVLAAGAGLAVIFGMPSLPLFLLCRGLWTRTQEKNMAAELKNYYHYE